MGSNNKYRDNKIKKEHTIIAGILPLLDMVSEIEEVKSIIPARISRRKGNGGKPKLKIKYKTISGIKLLAKTSSGIQEIFVIADDEDEVIERLKNLLD
ncbi:MAG: DUF2103 domain-containing protein [Fusobacteriota bacterium]